MAAMMKDSAAELSDTDPGYTNEDDKESVEGDEEDEASDDDASSAGRSSSAGSHSDDRSVSPLETRRGAAVISPSNDGSPIQSPGALSDEIKPKSRPGRRRKLSHELAQLVEDCPDLLGLRRSTRNRKETQRLKLSNSTDDEDRGRDYKTGRQRGRKESTWRGSSEEPSTSDSGCSSVKVSRKRVGRPRAKKLRGRQGRYADYMESSEDSDDSATRRTTRRTAAKVNYCEASSAETSDNEDAEHLAEEEGVSEATTEQVDTIEKVLKHRIGRVGAIGHQTTVYNVEDRGDPNANFDPAIEPSERQFLIKWTKWAHIHNTWETEAAILANGVRGSKKLENYIKRIEEIADWRKTADKDYIEYFECEQEMNEELYEQYRHVERIIAHTISPERGEGYTDYFVKWQGLPYSECTWEEESLITTRYQKAIDEYDTRQKSRKTPSKFIIDKVWTQRPKFVATKTQPTYLAGGNESFQLRDYQLNGINWRNSVILADEMGLGKTIQTIGFLSHLFHAQQLYGPFLIVVPLSTMTAWQKEFEQWAPELNVVTYIGDITSRDLIRQYEWYAQGGGKRVKFNCLLTTYEILLKDKSRLMTEHWAALCVDEAHRLKNDESLLYKSLFDFNTAHRLLITGTPLQNSLKELWALLHFIMPQVFDLWETFEAQHKDSEKRGYSSLHRELEPYLLRRVKKDVEKSLPAKVEQILRVDMTAVQKQYYKWILTKNYKALSKGLKGNLAGFLNIVMELKKCCNHSFLVRPPETEGETNQERLQQLIKSSGKLILLDKLLCRLHETGHRVLIFSQMVMMLDVLQEYLRLRKFNFQRLDGSIHGDVRRQALDHFNAEGSSDFCFLLSTRAGGLGINLATADTVIIFDSDWNPQNDLQAQSRAHRIGQTKQVNIYRLVTKSSVEEDIVERAKRKLVLDHLVIQRMDTTGRTVLSKNAVSTSSMPFNKEELSSILKFGAAELFKEKEGEEQEPEVDIDDILLRAETREMEHNSNMGDELLSAFKAANIKIDEDEDISQTGPGTHHHAPPTDEKDWEQIIPEDERRKAADEERLQQEQELALGPRQRRTIQQMARNEGSDEDWKPKVAHNPRDSESEGETSDEEGEHRRGRPRKKFLLGFTEAEVRRFLRSFRRFAHPLNRLEAIATDAELEEHSQAELRRLGEMVVEKCKQAVEEYEAQEGKEKENDEEGKKSNRGPVLKLGTLEMSVRLILKAQKELAPLDILIPSDKHQRKHFKLPDKVKQMKTWDVDWDELDDEALLRGIYQYGMCSWEAIKMDPDLGLTEKILLSKKTEKPQSKHLQTRAEYLLRVLQKHIDLLKPAATSKLHADDLTEDARSEKRKRPADTADKSKRKPKMLKENEDVVDKSRGRGKKRKGADLAGGGESTAAQEASPSKRQRKTVSKDAKTKKPHDAKASAPAVSTEHLRVSTDLPADLEPAVFMECKDRMRPVKKYLGRLREVAEPSGQHKQELYQCVLRIGDNINECLAEKSQTSELLKKWFNYLWMFVSKFCELEAVQLHKLYRLAIKQRSQLHHHHHGSTEQLADENRAQENTATVNSKLNHSHHHSKKEKEHRHRERKHEQDRRSGWEERRPTVPESMSQDDSVEHGWGASTSQAAIDELADKQNVSDHSRDVRDSEGRYERKSTLDKPERGDRYNNSEYNRNLHNNSWGTSTDSTERRTLLSAPVHLREREPKPEVISAEPTNYLPPKYPRAAWGRSSNGERNNSYGGRGGGGGGFYYESGGRDSSGIDDRAAEGRYEPSGFRGERRGPAGSSSCGSWSSDQRDPRGHVPRKRDQFNNDDNGGEGANSYRRYGGFGNSRGGFRQNSTNSSYKSTSSMHASYWPPASGGDRDSSFNRYSTESSRQ